MIALCSLILGGGGLDRAFVPLQRLRPLLHLIGTVLAIRSGRSGRVRQ